MHYRILSRERENERSEHREPGGISAHFPPECGSSWCRAPAPTHPTQTDRPTPVRTRGSLYTHERSGCVRRPVYRRGSHTSEGSFGELPLQRSDASGPSTGVATTRDAAALKVETRLTLVYRFRKRVRTYKNRISPALKQYNNNISVRIERIMP